MKWLQFPVGIILTALAYSHFAQAASIQKRYASPPVASSWDYALGYTWTASRANSSILFYSVDLFDTAHGDITAGVSAGHYMSCYFSAGTWENWRPDAKNFTAAMKGNKVSGWEGERWVDTRNPGLRTIMAARIKLAKAKGCMALDPDNTDGYTNDSGFPLKKSDAINYVNWICSQAHSSGMACGLKNNGGIIPNVIGNTEFVIDEQCVQYNECATYAPYIAAGKPVYHVEYTNKAPANATFKAKSCRADGQKQFSTIIKLLNLNKYLDAC